MGHVNFRRVFLQTDLIMSTLVAHEDIICQMIGNGYSDTQISNYLIMEMGIQRGASERSVRQFRMDRGFTKKSLSDLQLEVAVSEAIEKVCYVSP